MFQRYVGQRSEIASVETLSLSGLNFLFIATWNLITGTRKVPGKVPDVLTRK